MSAAKKEILFLSFFMVFALMSLQIPGVYTGSGQPPNLHQIKISKTEDIFYSLPDRTNQTNIVFYSGIPHSLADNYIHSDFYDGNINFISTSDYWIYPVNESKSRLILNYANSEYSAQLQLKKPNELPVVSLICDPDDFFSYENGIYRMGENRDFQSAARFYPMAWHKPANYFRKENDKRKIHFSFYNKEGKCEFNSYVFAEINGNATRCFPQKSLRITCDKDLGSKKLKADFFNSGIDFNSVVLRNGGNDNTKAFMRDMLMQSLMKNTGLLTSGFLPCEVYLNGEYWGIHILQNRVDQNFIAEKIHSKTKSITIVEDWKLAKGSEKEFQSLMRLISDENKLSYEKITQIIDETDLINYLIGELYFGNTDWPENNLKMYKVNSGKNKSLWKFAFFDLDYGFGYTGTESVNCDMFQHLNERNDPFSRIFKICLKNKKFRSNLKSQFLNLISNDLSEKNMLKRIDYFEELLAPGMQNHTERWRKPDSENEWLAEVELLREFAKKRNEIIRKQINTYLK